ncbi:hypothetical protein BEH94_00270 [Candidatus Altiarchaeales archaeon WOR_SM1_SCG]|nr:hypothetical protein BEH94_00270 [Candidatus Altiarchaeales archaeon WOR_SM1_SCG]
MFSKTTSPAIITLLISKVSRSSRIKISASFPGAIIPLSFRLKYLVGFIVAILIAQMGSVPSAIAFLIMWLMCPSSIKSPGWRSSDAKTQASRFKFLSRIDFKIPRFLAAEPSLIIRTMPFLNFSAASSPVVASCSDMIPADIYLSSISPEKVYSSYLLPASSTLNSCHF